MNESRNLETKLVPFLGTELMAAQDNDGQVWAAVRWLCDGIGLSTGQMQRQITNIGKDQVLSKGVANLPLPTNGGMQTVLCMKLEYVPLWLAKISVTPTMERETPEVAERLIQYQLRAKDALAAAFIQKRDNQTAKNYRESVDNRLSMYLKAKGVDKLLLLRCLRQDGVDPDMVDYVESVLRAEIESKAGERARATTADYQAILDYFFAQKGTLGFDKYVRGVKCYCIQADTVRKILKQRGVYDREFLKWAKDGGLILTGARGFTLTVHIPEVSLSAGCVCFIR